MYVEVYLLQQQLSTERQNSWHLLLRRHVINSCKQDSNFECGLKKGQKKVKETKCKIGMKKYCKKLEIYVKRMQSDVGNLSLAVIISM